jgi:hypothetical protein
VDLYNDPPPTGTSLPFRKVMSGAAYLPPLIFLIHTIHPILMKHASMCEGIGNGLI